MTIETLQSQLYALKLNTAAKELPLILAEQRSSIHTQWLVDLFCREIDSRKERSLEKKVAQAHFPELFSWESFNWEFDPELEKQKEKVEQLFSLSFVGKKQIVLFLGKPGTGKSHLAFALGLHAIYKGLKVFSSNVKKLAQDIILARERERLDVLFKKILAADLWILDDWGTTSFKKEVGEEIFDLLDKRIYSTALLLTSNRSLEEWPRVFHDPVLASASIDRIFDRATVIQFLGQSYRLKGKAALHSLDSISPSTL